MNVLEPQRELSIDVFPLDGVDPARMKHKENGNHADNLFYQMRQDGDNKWLFICHVDKPRNEAIAWNERWDIKIKGEYQAVCYDTMDGKIYPVKAAIKDGNTIIHHIASLHDSLLLKLLAIENSKKADSVNAVDNVVKEEVFKIPQNQKIYRNLFSTGLKNIIPCFWIWLNMHLMKKSGRSEKNFCVLIICLEKNFIIPFVWKRLPSLGLKR